MSVWVINLPIIAHLFPLGAFSSCTPLIWRFTQSARKCLAQTTPHVPYIYVRSTDSSSWTRARFLNAAFPFWKYLSCDRIASTFYSLTRTESDRTADPTRELLSIFSSARGAKKQNRAGQVEKRTHTDATGARTRERFSLFLPRFLSPRNAARTIAIGK